MGANSKSAGGFTIVELVTVMAVLGILSIGTISFLNNATNGYSATLSRAQLAEDSRLAVQRLTSELRRALPRSVRANGSCLEFVPTRSASSYLSINTTAASSSFESWPLDPVPSMAGLRAVVYPTGDLYSLSNPGAVSPGVSLSAPDAGNRVQVTLSAPHQFASESPQRKYFLITDPVSYCLNGGWLYRYINYGFSASQPSVAALPGGLPNRTVFAQNVSGSFDVSTATLSRNSEVVLDLLFSSGTEQVRLAHLVQVRNAP